MVSTPSGCLMVGGGDVGGRKSCAGRDFVLCPRVGWCVGLGCPGGPPRARAAPSTGRPLPRQGCCASLRDGLRAALDPGASAGLGQALSGRPGALPDGCAPSPKERRPVGVINGIRRGCHMSVTGGVDRVAGRSARPARCSILAARPPRRASWPHAPPRRHSLSAPTNTSPIAAMPRSHSCPFPPRRSMHPPAPAGPGSH